MAARASSPQRTAAHLEARRSQRGRTSHDAGGARGGWRDLRRPRTLQRPAAGRAGRRRGRGPGASRSRAGPRVKRRVRASAAVGHPTALPGAPGGRGRTHGGTPPGNAGAADSNDRRPGPDEKRPMNEDPHNRFLAWLLAGAYGDPPRDLALHASLCQDCIDWVGAHDALTRIDVGRAPLPPWRPTPIRPPATLRQAGRVAAATASMLLLGGAVLVGASQILAGRAGGGPERAGGVLAASGSPGESPSSTSPGSARASGTSTASATGSGAQSQSPWSTQPAATTYPVIAGTPRASGSIGPPNGTPSNSPPPKATTTPRPPPTPTVSPSPTPTPTPVETPTETPSSAAS